jgi:dephospho-CoA kinase
MAPPMSHFRRETFAGTLANIPRMHLFGLTGGIASGKSSVARIWRELGLPIIDADLLAREVVQPGAPALEDIRAEFGARYSQRSSSPTRRSASA